MKNGSATVTIDEAGRIALPEEIREQAHLEPGMDVRVTVLKDGRLEIEPDCMDCPDGQPHIAARCPDCDCAMVYRGHGHLGNGTPVHYFECVHSYREVHSVSIVVTD